MPDLLLSDENINAALTHLLEGKNQRDPEGNELYDLPSYWNVNRCAIEAAVRGSNYLPHIVKKTHLMQSVISNAI